MNPYRGEFEIEIRGKSYTLRPSFEALVEFEEHVGKSAIKAMQEMMSGDFSAKIITGAIYSGIRGYLRVGNNLGQSPSYNVIGQMVQSEGIADMAAHASRFLTYALSSDDEIRAQEERLKKETAEESVTTPTPSAQEPLTASPSDGTSS